MFHEEEDVPVYVREALCDRFDGWELAELLDISVADLIDALPETIIARLPQLKELCGLDQEEETDGGSET